MVADAIESGQKATDFVGKWMTGKGWAIWGFIGMAAGIVGTAGAAAAAPAAFAGAAATTSAVTGTAAATVSTATGAATNLQIFTSFWAGLFTDPLTGQMGIMPGLTNVFNGYCYLFYAGIDVLSAGATAISYGDPIFGSIYESLNAPASFIPTPSV